MFPWPYQPWMYTVTAPDEPVVKLSESWFHVLDELHVSVVAPPLTPMKA